MDSSGKIRRILCNHLAGSWSRRKSYLGQLKYVFRNYGKKLKQDPADIENMPVFQYSSENSRSKPRVYLWGMTKTGALGAKKYLIPSDPNRFALPCMHRPGRLAFADTHQVLDVACGYGFTVFAVKPVDNRYCVFGTGLNTDGQIGYQAARRGHPLEVILQPVPIEIPVVSKTTKVKRVACGRSHTVVVTDDEGVFTLGNNAFGQCGRKIIEKEDYFRNCKVTRLKEIDSKIVDAVCGQDHTLLLTDDGRVYGFGWSADGQTGLGHYHCQEYPSLLKGDIKSENIVQLSSSADCVLALNDRGDLFGWGNSEYGQFSNITKEQQLHTPVHIPMQKVGKIVHAAAGASICAVVNDSGELYVWGYGILGKGPKVTMARSPELLPPPLFGINELNPNRKVIKVYASIDFMAAVTDDADLYMWGNNKYGYLGIGHSDTQYFPLRVNLPAKLTKLSLGIDHTAALCKSFI